MAPYGHQLGVYAEVPRKRRLRRPKVHDIEEGLHAGSIAQRNLARKRVYGVVQFPACCASTSLGITPRNMEDQGSTDAERKAIAGRLKFARVAAGFRTAKEFAEKNGIPQPTYALHEGGKRGLIRDVALRYAELLQISVEWLLTGKQPSQPNATPEMGLVVVPVVGHVQAGEWRELLELPREEWREIFLPPDTRYLGMQRFGLEVAGSSMNLLYPEGSVVICVKLMDLGRDPRPGERVVVYRRCREGLFEVTVKEFVLDDFGKPWLWPRSTDPRYQQPIQMPSIDGDDENEDVRVHALVVGSYRPE